MLPALPGPSRSEGNRYFLTTVVSVILTNGPPGSTADAANPTDCRCISAVAAGLAVGSNSEPWLPLVIATYTGWPGAIAFTPDRSLVKLAVRMMLSVVLFGTTVSPLTLIRCSGLELAQLQMWLIGSPESISVCTSRKKLLKRVNS